MSSKRTRVLHCGWALNNGVCICGADAKSPKVQLAEIDDDINCKGCLNVLIHAAGKETVELRNKLNTARNEVDKWTMQRARL